MSFTCEKCGYKTEKSGNYNRHKTKKTQCKPKEFRCSGCLKEFANIKYLKLHQHACTDYQKEKKKALAICKNRPIEIKPFGYENLEYITSDLINKYVLKHKGASCILQLIRDIHFNISHPENTNFISSARNRIEYKLPNNLWRSVKFNDFMVDLFSVYYDMIIEKTTTEVPDRIEKQLEKSYLEISTGKGSIFDSYKLELENDLATFKKHIKEAIRNEEKYIKYKSYYS